MKKILSMILAVVMIALMIPFSAVTSAALGNIKGVHLNTPIQGFTMYNESYANTSYFDSTADSVHFQGKGSIWLNADTGIGARTIVFKFRRPDDATQLKYFSIYSSMTAPYKLTATRTFPEIGVGIYSDSGKIYCHSSDGVEGVTTGWNYFNVGSKQNADYCTAEHDANALKSGNDAIFTLTLVIGEDNLVDTFTVKAEYGTTTSEWGIDLTKDDTFKFDFGRYIGIGNAYSTYIKATHQELLSVSVTDKDGNSLLPDYMSQPFSKWETQGSTKAPTSVTYALDDASSGLADGNVTIDLPEYHNADKLNFYWGDANGKLAGYNSIGSAAVASKETRQVVYDMIPSTMIPPTATKLLVYPYDSWNGESTDCTAFDLATGSSYVMPEEEALSEFYVISDTHYGRTDAYDAQVKTALDYIAANSLNADGLFIVGDAIQGAVNDSSVAVSQYAEFAALCKSIDGLPNVYPAVGNHEFFGWYKSGDNQGAINAFVDNIKTNYTHIQLEDGETAKPYYDVELNGYQFIVLGATSQKNSTEGYLGDEQLTWLEAKLAAAPDDSPVFIMCHRSIANSVAQKVKDGSDEWADILDGEKLRAILDKYPNVVMFNGHTHYSLTGRTVNHMIGGGDEYVTFNTASVKDNLQGYYVSVYSDRVLVRGIDFETGEWISAAQFVVETDPSIAVKGVQARKNESDDTKADLRFLATLDRDYTNYEAIGFEFTYDGQVAERVCNHVYKSVYANGKLVNAEEDYGAERFYCFTLTGLSEGEYTLDIRCWTQKANAEKNYSEKITISFTVAADGTVSVG